MSDAPERIKEGDIVDVHFETLASYFRATVLFVPRVIGDSWILRLEDGKLVYVQMFCCMELHKGGE